VDLSNTRSTERRHRRRNKPAVAYAPVNIIFAGMVQFTTTIKQFGKQGEKTGWTYIEIPQISLKN
jgi:hypothetical protein